MQQGCVRGEGGERQTGMVSGAAGSGSDVGVEQDPQRAPGHGWEPPAHPARDRGIFPPLFAKPLEEMQPLISRRLKWRTRLPAEVTNSDRSDAVAMVTMVSWETPKGCHGIPSPIPLGPCSSRKKTFPDGSSSSIPQDIVARHPLPGPCPAAPPLCPTKHPQAISTPGSTCPSPWH